MYLYDDARIECYLGDQVPVLMLGPATVFADRSKLREIRDEISEYLTDRDAVSVRVVPAEAATGVTVDPDELLETMASTFEVRRDVP